jgi:hypothetical protein
LAVSTKSILIIAAIIVGTGAALLVPFLLQSARSLAITIGGLKDTYMPGENIEFTVSVEGRLERLSNYHTAPEVMIQQMPDEKVVYSNLVPYLATSCDSTPSYVSSHWAYGMKRENELYGINSQNETISLSKAGSYLVTASFEKATNLQQFSV